MSSACPIPSPVSRSVAPAASPTNSARPADSGSDPMRAGIGHALCGASATASGAEHRSDVGPREQVGPQLLHRLRRDRPTARDSEPDVRASAAERERPGVARQQVGLEPHPQLRRRRRADVARSTGGRRATRRGSRPPRRPASCAATTTCRQHRSPCRRARCRGLRPRARSRRRAGATPVSAAPSCTSAPASRARSRSSASSSVRRTTAA